MKQTIQQLVADGHFERMLRRNQEFIAGMVEREEHGRLVNKQYAYKELVRCHFANGCIALILQRGDDEARGNFIASVDDALKLVGAPGLRGGGLRAYDVNVELSEKGAGVTSLHEKVPAPGSEKLSIGDYHEALLAVVCFGNRPQCATVASVPEEAYKNPGTLAAPDYWAYLRAWKALILGDEDRAGREMSSAMSARERASKPESAAFVALLDNDQAALTASIVAAEKAYVKEMQKQLNNPVGAVYFPGLMLCRMAIDRGIPVADAPYLPVRFLPNYKPGTA
jgi:hypothetical protein